MTPLDKDQLEELEQLEKDVAEEMKTDEEQERREALEEIQKRGLFPGDAVPGEPERNLGDSSAILRTKYQERIEAALAGDDANTCNDDEKQKVAKSKQAGRCSIVGCTWTTLAPDHACYRCQCAVHLLPSQMSGLLFPLGVFA